MKHLVMKLPEASLQSHANLSSVQLSSAMPCLCHSFNVTDQSFYTHSKQPPKFILTISHNSRPALTPANEKKSPELQKLNFESSNQLRIGMNGANRYECP
jgi:hypothetical protein